MQSVTQRAIAAIGIDAPTDWELKPETHAAKLGPEAEPLKQILLKPSIKDIVAAYRKADDAAKHAQRIYKGLARLAAWTGFGAALIGAFVLMLALLFPVKVAITAAALVQAALLLISFGSSLIIGSLKPFETWMLRRAEAENARLMLFNHVIAEPQQSSSGTMPLLPLQLEYFRRYQLDVQRLYYRGRGERHAAAARRAWWWRLIALLLVVLAAVPLIWSVQGSAWMPTFLVDLADRMPARTEIAQRVFLGLGIIAAALQGLLASLAVTSLDERNAARYRSTFDNLDMLSEEPLEEARAAAAAVATDADEAARSARDTVLAFVALVQDQISSEHREWIALRKVAPDLERLKSLRLSLRT